MDNSETEDNKKRLDDNIEVARLIQNALLPEEDKLKYFFKDAFILYLPKDTVSGDFYWFQQFKGKTYIALVDCVGHGVSGAMMSMVGLQILSQVTRDYLYLPASDILNKLNELVISTFEQQGKHQFITYSFDIALCIIDKQEELVDFAGAKSNLHLIDSAGKLEIYQGDRFSIGYKIGSKIKTFKSHKFYYNEGDSVFLYTDGLSDQLSDEKNNYNKFLHQRVRNLLIENANLPMEKQKENILTAIRNWQGSSDQLDDISVIGIQL